MPPKKVFGPPAPKRSMKDLDTWFGDGFQWNPRETTESQVAKAVAHSKKLRQQGDFEELATETLLLAQHSPKVMCQIAFAEHDERLKQKKLDKSEWKKHLRRVARQQKERGQPFWSRSIVSKNSSKRGSCSESGSGVVTASAGVGVMVVRAAMGAKIEVVVVVVQY